MQVSERNSFAACCIGSRAETQGKRRAYLVDFPALPNAGTVMLRSPSQGRLEHFMLHAFMCLCLWEPVRRGSRTLSGGQGLRDTAN